MRRHLLLSTVVCAALLGSALTLTSADVQAAPAPSSVPAKAVPGRIVVVYDAGSTPRARAVARVHAKAVPVRMLGRERFQLVKPSPGRTVAQTIGALRSDPAVLAAAPDQIFHVQSVPNDPWLNQQWGLRNIGQAVQGVTRHVGRGHRRDPGLGSDDRLEVGDGGRPRLRLPVRPP